MKVTVLILGILFVNFGVAEKQSLQSRQTNWTVGQTVQTGSGPVNGHAAANATGVSEYLGIPYAMPPVGNLRFASPQNYSSNSTINGTSFVSNHALNLALNAHVLPNRDFLVQQTLHNTLVAMLQP